MPEFRLKVGEQAAVRPRWWGKSWSVVHAGSLPDGTVSIAVIWYMGHAAAAYNLYLSPDQREFELPFGTVHVTERSGEQIRLRISNGS